MTETTNKAGGNRGDKGPTGEETSDTGVRRSYSPPQVLSAEDLEAAAFGCNPPAAGKSSGDGCGQPLKPLGS